MMERKNPLRSSLFLFFAIIMVVTGPTRGRAATVRSEVHRKSDGFAVWYIVTSRRGFRPGDTWTLYTDCSRVRLPKGSCWCASRSGNQITFNAKRGLPPRQRQYS